MKNITLTTENTSQGWSVENIKEGDKLLVCNMANTFGQPLTTCDRHVKGVRVVDVKSVEKFGGVFFISTSEGEMSLTQCNSVTFYKN